MIGSRVRNLPYDETGTVEAVMYDEAYGEFKVLVAKDPAHTYGPDILPGERKLVTWPANQLVVL